ncbi:unnamed protein product, partial [Heterosigma akashiwo]
MNNSTTSPPGIGRGPGDDGGSSGGGRAAVRAQPVPGALLPGQPGGQAELHRAQRRRPHRARGPGAAGDADGAPQAPRVRHPEHPAPGQRRGHLGARRRGHARAGPVLPQAGQAP